jgi:hypothetical protein
LKFLKFLKFLKSRWARSEARSIDAQSRISEF